MKLAQIKVTIEVSDNYDDDQLEGFSDLVDKLQDAVKAAATQMLGHAKGFALSVD
jgi:hypothetical protein